MSVLQRRPFRLAVVMAGLVVLGIMWAGQGAAQPQAIQEKIFGDIHSGKDGFAFDHKIDPNTPAKDLLPAPPQQRPDVLAVPGDDLNLVPEVGFQAAPDKNVNPHNFLKETGAQTAKIRFVNKKEVDGFMKVLLQHRDDIAGLAFTMGDDCRMKKDHLADFQLGLDVLRKALKQTVPNGTHALVQPNALTASLFWNAYQEQWRGANKNLLVQDPFQNAHIKAAHVAGLTQVLMPDSSAMRQGLAKYLATVPTVEATQALARLAIFSPEKEVRQTALKGLKVRREKDYTGILLAGLQYPWPAVAQRAGEALVYLDCRDTVNNLVTMLDAPDPRAPVAKKVNGQEVHTAKQMVRLNHHRNCLMCHAPLDKDMPKEVVSAPMPVPGVPLGSFQEGYNSFGHVPDIFVRVDVTYLRQDFSVLLPVQNHGVWPKLQRFDFLVRSVQLTPAQAKELQGKLTPQAGATTPYQQTLLTTLRGLTGQDAAPNAAAWKKVLKA